MNSDVVRRATAISSGKLESARHYLEQLQAELAKLWTDRAANNASTGASDFDDDNRVLLKRELVSGRELADALDDLCELLKHSNQKTIEDQLRAQRIMKQGQSIVDRLKRISLMSDTNLVYYAERIVYSPPAQSEGNRYGRAATTTNQTAFYSLYGMPIDVSGYLAKWFNDNNVVVTSATLSDGENFNFFMRRVGMSVNRTTTLIVPSPFNYRDNVRLYLPRGSANANGGSFFNNLAAQITELLNAADGRALVLFTSHMALEAVWKRLNANDNGLRPARPLYKQGEAQMQRIISDFQSSANGVIFGTRSWWQGVDLPGMRLVIIDKLPFPQMNDPVIKARIDTIDGDGGNSFVNFTLPTAIITFRQGFGRLMRKENDRGVVVVCDERIVRQRYGSRFIKSLPNVGFLQNLNEVRKFVANNE
jgi:ATP-dependent DNA helicase DinG